MKLYRQISQSTKIHSEWKTFNISSRIKIRDSLQSVVLLEQLSYYIEDDFREFIGT